MAGPVGVTDAGGGVEIVVAVSRAVGEAGEDFVVDGGAVVACPPCPTHAPTLHTPPTPST